MKKPPLCLFVIAVLTLAGLPFARPRPAAAAADFSGAVGSNTTWSGQVNLTGDVWITNSAVLTITAGTVVTAAYSLMDIAHKEWGTCCIAYIYSQDIFCRNRR